MIDHTLNLEKPPQTNAPDARAHLQHLDGMRAIAALSVVCYHAYSEIANALPQNLPNGLNSFLNRIFFGNASVDVFIVLSGFCLSLSIARANAARIPGGNIQYFQRRARRILPSYFAAYFLSTLLLLLIPAMGTMPGLYSGGGLPPYSPIVVGSHLMLFHNLYTNWQISSNLPLWSVATEWQIYFLLPLYLLPLRNRYGSAILIIGAFALGLLLTQSGIVAARFWFIGLFALGMASAYVVYNPKSTPIRTHSQLLGCIAWAAAYSIHIWSPTAKLLSTIVAEDILIGLGTAALLIHTTYASIAALKSSFAQRLSSPWLVQLGRFSYSLYLCHAPVLVAVHYATLRLGVSSLASLLIQFLIAVPLAVFLAYLFHLCFEKPFLRSKTKAAI